MVQTKTGLKTVEKDAPPPRALAKPSPEVHSKSSRLGYSSASSNYRGNVSAKPPQQVSHTRAVGRPAWDELLNHDPKQFRLTKEERIRRARSLVSRNNVLLFPPPPPALPKRFKRRSKHRSSGTKSMPSSPAGDALTEESSGDLSGIGQDLAMFRARISQLERAGLEGRVSDSQGNEDDIEPEPAEDALHEHEREEDYFPAGSQRDLSRITEASNESRDTQNQWINANSSSMSNHWEGEHDINTGDNTQPSASLPTSQSSPSAIDSVVERVVRLEEIVMVLLSSSGSNTRRDDAGAIETLTKHVEEAEKLLVLQGQKIDELSQKLALVEGISASPNLVTDAENAVDTPAFVPPSSSTEPSLSSISTSTVPMSVSAPVNSTMSSTKDNATAASDDAWGSALDSVQRLLNPLANLTTTSSKSNTSSTVQTVKEHSKYSGPTSYVDSDVAYSEGVTPFTSILEASTTHSKGGECDSALDGWYERLNASVGNIDIDDKVAYDSVAGNIEDSESVRWGSVSSPLQRASSDVHVISVEGEEDLVCWGDGAPSHTSMEGTYAHNTHNTFTAAASHARQPIPVLPLHRRREQQNVTDSPRVAHVPGPATAPKHPLATRTAAPQPSLVPGAVDNSEDYDKEDNDENAYTQLAGSNMDNNVNQRAAILPSTKQKAKPLGNSSRNRVVLGDITATVVNTSKRGLGEWYVPRTAN